MKKKLLMTLTITLCAVLLVVGSVAGTMAYLRATAEVTNTFTYGQVALTMDESQIGADGMTPVEPEQRVPGNRYMLMPGTTYKKDPIIHIGAESQAMYLFVKIDNGIAGLAAEEDDAYESIHEQMLANGWSVLPMVTDPASGDATHNGFYNNTIETPTNAGITMIGTSTVYFYGAVQGGTTCVPTVVSGKDENKDIATFTSFKTSSLNTTGSKMAAYVNNNAKITVLAYAVQASGFDNIHQAANIFAGEWTSAIPTVNVGG